MNSKNKLVAGVVFVLFFSGCSSKGNLPPLKLPSVNHIPRCGDILNSNATYWSQFRDGKIYLYTANNQKCLLRIVGESNATRPSNHLNQTEAHINRVSRDKQASNSRFLKIKQ